MLCAHMFIPISLLPEVASTHHTRIRPFICMNPSVIIQSVRTEKSLLTNITSISSVVCMNKSMLIIHRTSEKALITNSALERSLTSVDLSNVILEIRAYCIPCFTSFMWASKWFYTLVKAHMLP